MRRQVICPTHARPTPGGPAQRQTALGTRLPCHWAGHHSQRYGRAVNTEVMSSPLSRPPGGPEVKLTVYVGLAPWRPEGEGWRWTSCHRACSQPDHQKQHSPLQGNVLCFKGSRCHAAGKRPAETQGQGGVVGPTQCPQGVGTPLPRGLSWHP